MRRYTLALGSPPSPTLKAEVELAQRAEEAGFEAVLLAEFFYNAHVPLTAIAAATSRIRVGTQCSVIRYRSPTMAAMDAAIIDELSGGRVVLGLAQGSPVAVAPMGLTFDRAKLLTRMREYVEIVRRLLDGESVTYAGEVYSVEGAQLWIRPVQPRIPIMLGVVYPRMCQLAGEIADSVLIQGGTSPGYIRHAIENVRIGAERAGRSLDDIDVGATVFTSYAREDARHFIGWWMCFQPLMDVVWEQMGIMEVVRRARAHYDAGDTERAFALVDDEILDQVMVAGDTPEECRERLEPFWNAGLDFVNLCARGPGVTDADVARAQAGVRRAVEWAAETIRA